MGKDLIRKRRPNRLAGFGLGVLALSLAAFLSCSGSFPSEDLPWHETFQDAPGAPWTWIRENPANYRLAAGGLEIRLEPGGLMGGGRDAKNILVRDLPEEAAAVGVDLLFNPVEQFEQAGLIFYVDDDNYIKLVKERVDGQAWVVMAVEIEAEIQFLNKMPLLETDGQAEDAVTLSLEFTPEGVKGIFKQEERVEMAGHYPFPMVRETGGGVFRVGIFTQSGHESAERWARFADFRIAAAPLVTPS